MTVCLRVVAKWLVDSGLGFAAHLADLSASLHGSMNGSKEALKNLQETHSNKVWFNPALPRRHMVMLSGSPKWIQMVKKTPKAHVVFATVWCGWGWWESKSLHPFIHWVYRYNMNIRYPNNINKTLKGKSFSCFFFNRIPNISATSLICFDHSNF